MARKKRLSWDNWRNLWINVPENLLSNFTTPKYSPRGDAAVHIIKAFIEHIVRNLCAGVEFVKCFTPAWFLHFTRDKRINRNIFGKNTFNLHKLLVFCAIIYSNIAWIHTANLHRKGIFLRQFLKSLPKGKWIYFSAASDASDKLLCIKNDKVLKS